MPSGFLPWVKPLLPPDHRPQFPFGPLRNFRVIVPEHALVKVVLKPVVDFKHHLTAAHGAQSYGACVLDAFNDRGYWVSHLRRV